MFSLSFKKDLKQGVKNPMFGRSSGTLYSLLIVAIIFGRFCAGVVWYMYIAEGNLIKLTKEIWLVRLLYDGLFTYPLMTYFILTFINQ